MFIKYLAALVALLLLASCQIDKAALRDAVNAASSSSSSAPSNTDSIGAIKAALQQGVTESVASLGRANGFSSDDRVKITMPDGLNKVDGILRSIGQEKYADQFVDTLNRAAEKATPVAKDVFIGAIKKMSVTDAIGIIKGSDNAATDYFKRVANTELTGLFKPIVTDATNSVGVTSSYKKLSSKLALVGYQPKVNDLDGYVTDKALDGLYLYISDKEKAIRANPGQAASDLVKNVFSYYLK